MHKIKRKDTFTEAIMNYFPFLVDNNFQILQELNIINEKIRILEAKINKLEKNNNKDYLEKDDNYHMI